MADRFYSVTVFGNDKITEVVENAASQAGNVVEVRVTYDAANNSKFQLQQALDTILAAILKETWPPV